MRFRLLRSHSEILAKSENKERGPDDARYSCRKSDSASNICPWVIVAIADSTHRHNGTPQEVCEGYEIRVAFLSQAQHSGEDDDQSCIEDGQRVQGVGVEERFGAKRTVVLITINAAHSACPGGEINGGANNGIIKQVDPTHHKDFQQ